MGNLLRRVLAFVLGIVFTLGAAGGSLVGGAYWAYKNVKPVAVVTPPDGDFGELREQTIEDLVALLNNAFSKPDEYTLRRLNAEYGIKFDKLLEKMGIEEGDIDKNSKEWAALMGVSLFKLKDGIVPFLETVKVRALYNFLPKVMGGKKLDEILSEEAQEKLGDYSIMELVRTDDAEGLGLLKALRTLKIGAFLPGYFEAEYNPERHDYIYRFKTGDDDAEKLRILEIFGNVQLGVIQDIINGTSIMSAFLDGGFSAVADMPVADILYDIAATFAPDIAGELKNRLRVLGDVSVSDLFIRGDDGGFEFYLPGLLKEIKAGYVFGYERGEDGVWYDKEGEPAKDFMQLISNFDFGEAFADFVGKEDIFKTISDLLGDLNVGMILDIFGVKEGQIPALDGLRKIEVGRLLDGQSGAFDFGVFAKALISNLHDSLEGFTVGDLIGVENTGNTIPDAFLDIRPSDFLLEEYTLENVVEAFRNALGDVSVGSILGYTKDDHGQWICDNKILALILDFSVDNICDAAESDYTVPSIMKALFPDLTVGDAAEALLGIEYDGKSGTYVKKFEDGHVNRMTPGINEFLSLGFADILSGLIDKDYPVDIYTELNKMTYGDIAYSSAAWLDHIPARFEYNGEGAEKPFVWSGDKGSGMTAFMNTNLMELTVDHIRALEIDELIGFAGGVLRTYIPEQKDLIRDVEEMLCEVVGGTLGNPGISGGATVGNIIDKLHAILKHFTDEGELMSVILDGLGSIFADVHIDSRIGEDLLNIPGSKVLDAAADVARVLVAEDYADLIDPVRNLISKVLQGSIGKPGLHENIFAGGILRDVKDIFDIAAGDFGLEMDEGVRNVIDVAVEELAKLFDGVRVSKDFLDDLLNVPGSKALDALTAVAKAVVPLFTDGNYDNIIDAAVKLVRDILKGAVGKPGLHEDLVAGTILRDLKDVYDAVAADFGFEAGEDVQNVIDTAVEELAKLFDGVHVNKDFLDDLLNVPGSKALDALTAVAKSVMPLFTDGNYDNIIDAAVKLVRDILKGAVGKPGLHEDLVAGTVLRDLKDIFDAVSDDFDLGLDGDVMNVIDTAAEELANLLDTVHVNKDFADDLLNVSGSKALDALTEIAKALMPLLTDENYDALIDASAELIRDILKGAVGKPGLEEQTRLALILNDICDIIAETPLADGPIPEILDDLATLFDTVPVYLNGDIVDGLLELGIHAVIDTAGMIANRFIDDEKMQEAVNAVCGLAQDLVGGNLGELQFKDWMPVGELLEDLRPMVKAFTDDGEIIDKVTDRLIVLFDGVRVGHFADDTKNIKVDTVIDTLAGITADIFGDDDDITVLVGEIAEVAKAYIGGTVYDPCLECGKDDTAGKLIRQIWDIIYTRMDENETADNIVEEIASLFDTVFLLDYREDLKAIRIHAIMDTACAIVRHILGESDITYIIEDLTDIAKKFVDGTVSEPTFDAHVSVGAIIEEDCIDISETVFGENETVKNILKSLAAFFADVYIDTFADDFGNKAIHEAMDEVTYIVDEILGEDDLIAEIVGGVTEVLKEIVDGAIADPEINDADVGVLIQKTGDILDDVIEDEDIRDTVGAVVDELAAFFAGVRLFEFADDFGNKLMHDAIDTLAAIAKELTGEEKLTDELADFAKSLFTDDSPVIPPELNDVLSFGTVIRSVSTIMGIALDESETLTKVRNAMEHLATLLDHVPAFDPDGMAEGFGALKIHDIIDTATAIVDEFLDGYKKVTEKVADLVKHIFIEDATLDGEKIIDEEGLTLGLVIRDVKNIIHETVGEETLEAILDDLATLFDDVRLAYFADDLYDKPIHDFAEAAVGILGDVIGDDHDMTYVVGDLLDLAELFVPGTVGDPGFTLEVPVGEIVRRIGDVCDSAFGEDAKRDAALNELALFFDDVIVNSFGPDIAGKLIYDAVDTLAAMVKVYAEDYGDTVDAVADLLKTAFKPTATFDNPETAEDDLTLGMLIDKVNGVLETTDLKGKTTEVIGILADLLKEVHFNAFADGMKNLNVHNIIGAAADIAKVFAEDYDDTIDQAAELVKSFFDADSVLDPVTRNEDLTIGDIIRALGNITGTIEEIDEDLREDITATSEALAELFDGVHVYHDTLDDLKTKVFIHQAIDTAAEIAKVYIDEEHHDIIECTAKLIKSIFTNEATFGNVIFNKDLTLGSIIRDVKDIIYEYIDDKADDAMEAVAGLLDGVHVKNIKEDLGDLLIREIIGTAAEIAGIYLPEDGDTVKAVADLLKSAFKPAATVANPEVNKDMTAGELLGNIKDVIETTEIDEEIESKICSVLGILSGLLEDVRLDKFADGIKGLLLYGVIDAAADIAKVFAKNYTDTIDQAADLVKSFFDADSTLSSITGNDELTIGCLIEDIKEIIDTVKDIEPKTKDNIDTVADALRDLLKDVHITHDTLDDLKTKVFIHQAIDTAAVITKVIIGDGPKDIVDNTAKLIKSIFTNEATFGNVIFNKDLTLGSIIRDVKDIIYEYIGDNEDDAMEAVAGLLDGVHVKNIKEDLGNLLIRTTIDTAAEVAGIYLPEDGDTVKAAAELVKALFDKYSTFNPVTFDGNLTIGGLIGKAHAVIDALDIKEGQKEKIDAVLIELAGLLDSVHVFKNTLDELKAIFVSETIDTASAITQVFTPEDADGIVDKSAELVKSLFKEGSTLGNIKFNDGLTVGETLTSAGEIVKAAKFDKKAKDKTVEILSDLAGLLNEVKYSKFADGMKALKLHDVIDTAAAITKVLINEEYGQSVLDAAKLVKSVFDGKSVLGHIILNSGLTLGSVIRDAKNIDKLHEKIKTKYDKALDRIAELADAVRIEYFADDAKALKIREVISAAEDVTKELTDHKEDATVEAAAELVKALFDKYSTFNPVTFDGNLTIGGLIGKAQAVIDALDIKEGQKEKIDAVLIELAGLLDSVHVFKNTLNELKAILVSETIDAASAITQVFTPDDADGIVEKSAELVKSLFKEGSTLGNIKFDDALTVGETLISAGEIVKATKLDKDAKDKTAAVLSDLAELLDKVRYGKFAYDVGELKLYAVIDTAVKVAKEFIPADDKHHLGDIADKSADFVKLLIKDYSTVASVQLDASLKYGALIKSGIAIIEAADGEKTDLDKVKKAMGYLASYMDPVRVYTGTADDLKALNVCGAIETVSLIVQEFTKDKYDNIVIESAALAKSVFKPESTFGNVLYSELTAGSLIRSLKNIIDAADGDKTDLDKLKESLGYLADLLDSVHLNKNFVKELKAILIHDAADTAVKIVQVFMNDAYDQTVFDTGELVKMIFTNAATLADPVFNESMTVGGLLRSVKNIDKIHARINTKYDNVLESIAGLMDAVRVHKFVKDVKALHVYAAIDTADAVTAELTDHKWDPTVQAVADLAKMLFVPNSTFAPLKADGELTIGGLITGVKGVVDATAGIKGKAKEYTDGVLVALAGLFDSVHVYHDTLKELGAILVSDTVDTAAEIVKVFVKDKYDTLIEKSAELVKIIFTNAATLEDPILDEAMTVGSMIRTAKDILHEVYKNEKLEAAICDFADLMDDVRIRYFLKDLKALNVHAAIDTAADMACEFTNNKWDPTVRAAAEVFKPFFKAESPIAPVKLRGQLTVGELITKVKEVIDSVDGIKEKAKEYTDGVFDALAGMFAGVHVYHDTLKELKAIPVHNAVGTAAEIANVFIKEKYRNITLKVEELIDSVFDDGATLGHIILNSGLTVGSVITGVKNIVGATNLKEKVRKKTCDVLADLAAYFDSVRIEYFVHDLKQLKVCGAIDTVGMIVEEFTRAKYDNIVVKSAELVKSLFECGDSTFVHAVFNGNLTIGMMITDVMEIIDETPIKKNIKTDIDTVMIALSDVFDGVHVFKNTVKELKEIKIRSVVNAAKEIIGVFKFNHKIKNPVIVALDEIKGLYPEEYGVKDFVPATKAIKLRDLIGAAKTVGDEVINENISDADKATRAFEISNAVKNLLVDIADKDATVANPKRSEEFTVRAFVKDVRDVTDSIKHLNKTADEIFTQIAGLYPEDAKFVNIVSATKEIRIDDLIDTVTPVLQTISEFRGKAKESVMNYIAALVKMFVDGTVSKPTFNLEVKIKELCDLIHATVDFFSFKGKPQVLMAIKQIGGLYKDTDTVKNIVKATGNIEWSAVIKAIRAELDLFGNINDSLGRVYELAEILMGGTIANTKIRAQELWDALDKNEKTIVIVAAAAAGVGLYFMANPLLVKIIDKTIGHDKTWGELVAKELGFVENDGHYEEKDQGYVNSLIDKLMPEKVSETLTKGYDFKGKFGEHLTMGNILTAMAKIKTKAEKIIPGVTPLTKKSDIEWQMNNSLYAVMDVLLNTPLTDVWDNRKHIKSYIYDLFYDLRIADFAIGGIINRAGLNKTLNANGVDIKAYRNPETKDWVFCSISEDDEFECVYEKLFTRTLNITAGEVYSALKGKLKGVKKLLRGITKDLCVGDILGETITILDNKAKSHGNRYAYAVHFDEAVGRWVGDEKYKNILEILCNLNLFDFIEGVSDDLKEYFIRDDVLGSVRLGEILGDGYNYYDEFAGKWYGKDGNPLEFKEVVGNLLENLYNCTIREWMDGVTIEDLIGDSTLGEAMHYVYDAELDEWFEKKSAPLYNDYGGSIAIGPDKVMECELDPVDKKLAGMSIKDIMKDGFDIMDIIGEFTLGEFIGYHKESETEYYNYYKDYAGNCAYKEDMYGKGRKVPDMNKPADKLTNAVAKVYIKDIMDKDGVHNLFAEIKGLKVGYVLGYEEPVAPDTQWVNPDNPSEPINISVNKLCGYTVENVIEHTEDILKEFTLGEIIPIDVGSPNVLRLLEHVAMCDVSDRVEELFIGEIMGYVKNDTNHKWYKDKDKSLTYSTGDELLNDDIIKCIVDFTLKEVMDGKVAGGGKFSDALVNNINTNVKVSQFIDHGDVDVIEVLFEKSAYDAMTLEDFSDELNNKLQADSVTFGQLQALHVFAGTKFSNDPMDPNYEENQAFLTALVSVLGYSNSDEMEADSAESFFKKLSNVIPTTPPTP